MLPEWDMVRPIMARGMALLLRAQKCTFVKCIFPIIDSDRGQVTVQWRSVETGVRLPPCALDQPHHSSRFA